MLFDLQLHSRPPQLIFYLNRPPMFQKGQILPKQKISRTNDLFTSICSACFILFASATHQKIFRLYNTDKINS